MRTVDPATSTDLHSVLRKYWGYERFRPMQEEVMRSVLNGRDTLALLPTGGGKSLCFQVPALAIGRLCLVVSPLIALMKDQVERLRSMGISARAVVSGMSYAEIDNALESAALGKLSFLYASPERLGSDLFQARLHRLPLGLIAVDEAHCLSQWGYDFRPSYLKVREVREKRPEVPVLALTASATPTVAADIMDKLGFAASNLLRGDFHRPELVLWASKGEDKLGRLLKIIENVPGTLIVYVRQRRATVRTAHFLAQHGVNAAAYHAGLPTEERDRVQGAWTKGEVRCVVATNAFGMGIDKADVRAVIHLDPPSDLESYYQEAGRGGRDGKQAYAFLLSGPGDEDRLRERVSNAFPELKDIRRTYQAFADMNAIAIGSGLMETYEIDMRALADRTQLPIGTVAQAIKALELDGKLVLSEGMRSPSRVMITVDQKVIYNMRVNDARTGPLIEALLRLHGGLFEEAAVIDENRIARLMDWHADTVRTRLQELDKLKVLSYRPRSDAPAITLLVPRQDAARLTLDPAVLRDRQQRATDRMEAMLGYLNSTEQCRERILLAYFGQPSATDCGRCDVCKSRPAIYTKTEATQATVSEPLAHYERSIDELRWEADEFGLDPEGDRA